MSGLFINHSGPYLNQFGVDPKDDVLVLVDEGEGDSAGNDK